MKCPRCGSELRENHGNGAVGYRCPSGCGSFMTLAALRSLGVPAQLTAELWRNARIGNTIPGQVCPNCRRRMQLLKLGDDDTCFDLDICTGCQSLWFDPGELERLPQSEPPPEPPPRPELNDLQPVTAGADTLPDEDGWEWRMLIPALLALPVERYPRKLSRLPVVTWFLSALCLVLFVWLILQNDPAAAIREWGLIPDLWRRHGGLTLITSMFLHAGILHLLGNVYFLLMCGDDAEDVLGHGNYLLLILFSGLSAELLHGAFGGQPDLPCVGASGFISGVIAFYAFTFPKATIGIWLLGSRAIFAAAFIRRFWLNLPAWCWFAFFVLFQLIGAWLDRSGQIAYFGHLGGIVPGIAFALWNKFNRDAPDIEN